MKIDIFSLSLALVFVFSLTWGLEKKDVYTASVNDNYGSRNVEEYDCTVYTICLPYKSCSYEGLTSLKWCDKEKSKVCCPKSAHADMDTGNGYQKNRKSKPYDHERKLFNSEYEHPRYKPSYSEYEEYPYDYYENGYYGPALSLEAKRVLGTYKERECGVRQSFYGRISTGHVAELGTTKYGEFPWHAAILLRIDKQAGYRKAYEYLCGATVINPVMLLTAAHCVKGIKVKHLAVKLGEWNLKGTHGEMFPAIKRSIKRIIIHEHYDSGTFSNDVSILVLDKLVNLRKTPHVSPICLPPKKLKFEEYTKCYIVGWGKDTYKPNYGSNLLKIVSVSLLKEDCSRKLKESVPSLSDYVSKGHLRCIMGSLGKDACVGDGGGAVVCPFSNNEVPVCKDEYNCKHEHYFMAGIISWGSDKCGQESSVTAITDFQYHRNWIADKARPYGGLDSYDYTLYENYRSRHEHNFMRYKYDYYHNEKNYDDKSLYF